ncbi:MAG: hypothetical protein RR359_02155 [Bacilli bacterium]
MPYKLKRIINIKFIYLICLFFSFAFFTYTGQEITKNVITACSITFSYSAVTAKGNEINIVNEMSSGCFGSNNLNWATMKTRLYGIGISTAKISQN